MHNWTAEEIKCLRLRLGWSAADFARRFGCISNQVLAWERGDSAPSPDDVLQLHRLQMHVESYSEQLQREPLAEHVIKLSGCEQIHNDVLISYLKN